MIPLKDCKHRGIYIINSRNLTIAVYDENTHGFTGIRLKFHDYFLDTEYHHDADPNHGTATPLQYLHQLPDHIHHNEQTPTTVTQEILDNLTTKHTPKIGDTIQRTNTPLHQYLDTLKHQNPSESPS